MFRRNVSSGNPFEETYGYSRAVRVGGQVYVSGTTASGADLGGDAYTQTRSALSIINGALADVGASLSDVVRTTVYIVDMSDLEGVSNAHAETFGHIRPASTLVQVTGLTPAAAVVEVEVTAVTD
ncbi:RidA family protein [Phytoactinopolyspora limicola]|uniref:RidA family protein n=1 Tax=Phytoactinopolyspora limicola TaxID=2715536 RepID=UPI001408B098|nr:RidA family protein [Phytoactinopolyspora limicola]